MMTLEALLTRIGALDSPGARTRIEHTLERPGTRDAPVLIAVFLAIGSWVGGLLGAWLLLELELLEQPAMAAVVGVSGLAAATWLTRRRPPGIVVIQLSWIAVIGGQLALVMAVEPLVSREIWLSVFVGLLQIPVIWAVASPGLRLLCTMVSIGAFTLLLVDRGRPQGLVFLLLGLVVSVGHGWLQQSAWLSSRWAGLWRPVAWGLAAGSLMPVAGLLDSSVDFVLPIATSMLAALLIAIGITALREAGSRPRSPSAAVLIAVVALVAALTHDTPGVLASLALLALGRLRGERSLQIVGLLALGGFLFALYARLQVPLLQTSAWVMATGGALLVAYMVVRRMVGEPRESDQRLVSLHPRDLGRLSATSGVALALVAAQVGHKAWIVDRGTLVFLRLRPRDPRALIQGDYMRLHYELQRHARQPPARRGRLVLELDPRGVGSFDRFWEGAPLAEGEQLLRYRIEGDRPRLHIGAESYLLEADTAAAYEHAEYAALRVSEGGTPVLVDLRDDALQPLPRLAGE